MRSVAAAVAISSLLFAAPLLAGEGDTVPYEVAGKAYEGYYVAPRPGAPLVLLIHDWDGLGDYEVKRSQMLAELGYAVFAADLFGAGVRPATLEDRRRHTGQLYADRAKLRTLLKGALDAAKGRGADLGNAVAMGYCFGGAAVLELARSGADLKGFVSFHGGLETPAGQDYSRAKGQYLVLHGTADTAVTLDHFAGLAAELEAAGLPHEMVTYGGAPHAFTVFGGDRHREDADRKSWALFARFLADVLGNLRTSPPG
ncbi:MAG: dienelactone hydrolase family protein [Thermodesulfobacteriota bacterium]